MWWCYETIRVSEVQGKEKLLTTTNMTNMSMTLLRTKTAMNLKRVDRNVKNLRDGFFSFFIVLKITSSEMWIFLGLFICYRQWHSRDRSVQSVLNVSMTKTNVLGCWVVDTASARVAWKGYSVVTPLIVPNAEIQLSFHLGSMVC